MINVLGWYEILYAVGINLGPGLPVLFYSLDIQLGWWKINANNGLQVLTAVFILIIFGITWFQVIDLSKELESIKAEFERNDDSISKQTFDNSNSEQSKIKTRSIIKDAVDVEMETERKLMRWRDLLQFDIILLALSFALLRMIVMYVVTDVTLVSTHTFHWEMKTLGWLYVVIGTSSYFFIALLIKFNIFKGRSNIFFFYVIAICVSMIALTMLLLPKAVDFQGNLPKQVAFGGSALFLKCFSMFQANSSGKFLIFNTVSFENANFVDGFRSFVGNLFRMLANGTVFYLYLYPEYIVPVIFMCGVVIIVLLLNRRDTHLSSSKKQK